MPEYCLVDKSDHVMTVTLNRPDRLNALHSLANAELGEVFDDFANDDDMWVAIVTGAGQGLGRCHALALAERGAKVVVNDLGNDNGVSEHADAVVQEITAAGGEAMSHGANVADFTQVQDMVQQAMDKWGRIDILVNNAGILRDKTFAKMPLDDFRLVIEVHLMGSVNCTKAVWEIMGQRPQMAGSRLWRRS